MRNIIKIILAAEAALITTGVNANCEAARKNSNG